MVRCETDAVQRSLAPAGVIGRAGYVVDTRLASTDMQTGPRGQTMWDRRFLLQAGLTLPLALRPKAVLAADPIPIADMHFHSFFGDSIYHCRPVAKTMADGKATLVTWAISGDALWIAAGPRGFVQKAQIKPGEAFGYFQRDLARIKAHAAEQKLKIVRTAADVDRAVAGDPHIVLAVEGANFIEGDIHRVQLAYDLGLRHLQLVHYSTNTLGDYQTVAPQHRGLTDLGRKVVKECNRLGIVVDLAHATPQAVDQVLSLSTMPVVWSHSSVTKGPAPNWTMIGWKARQLSLDTAKAIASKGGIIGLWAFAPDVGRTPEDYARRLAELAEWLGEDHAAIGSDINGLGKYASIHNYADLRRAVDYLDSLGLGRSRLHKLAIGNYARVLKAALAGKK